MTDQSGGVAGLEAQPLSSSPRRRPAIFAVNFPPIPGIYSLAIIDGIGYGDALEMRADELELDLAGCLDAPL